VLFDPKKPGLLKESFLSLRAVVVSRIYDLLYWWVDTFQ
tara:strand:+ start:692 stop:808 length:117 start_codon:yes stop_codon:yes gene_type:complete